jgi:hypothetical protein
MTPTPWDRDLLPEFLWLAALSEGFAIKRVHQPFYRFMDAIDEFWDQPIPALGFISDFGMLRHRSDEIWAKHESLLISLFHDTIGRPLSLYPENPASWLVRQDLIDRHGPVNPEVELTKLRRLVVKLLPGRDGDVAHLRTLPVARLIMHGKLQFPPNPMLDECFPNYPHATTPDQDKIVQSTCRAFLNAFLLSDERFRNTAWPQSFWRHNMNLLPCRPLRRAIPGGQPATEADLPRIKEVLVGNGEGAMLYLHTAGLNHHYDLYDPERDEILLGLLARCVRLYTLVATDPNLWARDTSAIMLRCLVDSSINFCYLGKLGTSEEFRKFREYGEGQEKLLMLHLQDNHPSASTPEGRSPFDISEELGGFYPELIEIELGHWNKKDARQLAASVGMEEYYRVVYSPASSDLHGGWFSLKHSSLWRCAEPLHRFHRIPAYSEPMAYLSTVDTATKLLQYTLKVGHEVLDLVEPPKLKMFSIPEVTSSDSETVT